MGRATTVWLTMLLQPLTGVLASLLGVREEQSQFFPQGAPSLEGIRMLLVHTHLVVRNRNALKRGRAQRNSQKKQGFSLEQSRGRKIPGLFRGHMPSCYSCSPCVCLCSLAFLTDHPPPPHPQSNLAAPRGPQPLLTSCQFQGPADTDKHL